MTRQRCAVIGSQLVILGLSFQLRALGHAFAWRSLAPVALVIVALEAWMILRPRRKTASSGEAVSHSAW